MTPWWLLSYVALWLVVLVLGFLLLGALRALGLLRWRLEQLEAATPTRTGRSGLKPGKKAPDFTLPCASGGEVSLHDFAGRRVFLVFTMSGCKPCHRIIPELNKLQRGGDIQVLVVNNGEPEATRQWAAEARASFPVPEWLMNSARNTAHYRPGWRPDPAIGAMHIRVAEDGRGRVVAYVYYQTRPEGELYLREIAAGPPDWGAKVPYAGTTLLGYALEDAWERGLRGQATLNVLGPHRVASDAAGGRTRWRDPVAYYERFGYEVQAGVRGRLADGSLGYAEDTWMSGAIGVVLRNVLAALRGRRDASGAILGGRPLRAG